MKSYALLLLTLASTNLLANGGPRPKRGTYFSATFKNFDKSITFMDPALLYDGRLIRISAWSKAEGVCRMLGREDVIDARIVMQRTGRTETMMRLGSQGQALGAIADNVHVASITCLED